MIRKRELVAQYESDNGKRKAIIFDRSQYVDYKTRENDDRAIIVQETEFCFECEFYENQRKIGYITYPRKALVYVESAAENWVTFVMDRNTIKQYGKVV